VNERSQAVREDVNRSKYRPGEGGGLIGAVVGAIIVLVIYGMVAGGRKARNLRRTHIAGTNSPERRRL